MPNLRLRVLLLRRSNSQVMVRKQLNDEQKEEARQRAHLWYLNNKDKARESFIKYWAKPEVRKRKSEYDKVRRTEKADHITEVFNEWYSKNSKSCIERAKKWKQGHPIMKQYHRYYERAKHKNWDFEFTREEFEAFIQEPCVYCGFPNPLGIDRIDSSVGYTKKNSVPCCKVCNYMKLNHPVEEFLFHLKRIINHLEL